MDGRYVLCLYFLVCGLHCVLGISEQCKERCEDNISLLKNTTTPLSDIQDACATGCRMSQLDVLLTWPLVTDNKACVRSCIEGYNDTFDEQLACSIGCNVTISCEFSENNQESFPQESFFAYVYQTITLPFVSRTSKDSGDLVEIDAFTIDSVPDSDGYQAKQTIVYILGSSTNDELELSTENTSQESTLLYASSHCFWMILHVIYIAVIIASLVLCFCMFVGNPERQLDTDEKERVRDAIEPYPPTKVPVNAYNIPIKMGLNGNEDKIRC